jgi:Ca2+-binding EF-hand superfamily protein
MPAALSQSNLYLLGDAPNSPPAGDTSILLCFSRGFQQPQMLYLKFDSLAGFPPRLGVNPTSPPEFPAPSPAWMLAAGDFLFFGRERSALVMTGPPNLGDNFPAGVWLLPRSQIEPIIAGQAKGSLGKYDRNHDGVIDAGERAAALDDPDFIKSQLDMIDANHNGRLDLGELAYFDVNQDRLLEPNEVAGIEIAQRLLAENELKTFDDNGDGVLNQTEFRSLCRSGFDVGFDADPVFWGFDENHDQKIDVTELTTFMTQWTREKLRPRPSGRLLSPVLITPGMFKDELEAYWRDPSSINRPPPHRRLTLERMQEFLRTHQMPNGPAQ